jgi:hypothetical protein
MAMVCTVSARKNEADSVPDDSVPDDSVVDDSVPDDPVVDDTSSVVAEDATEDGGVVAGVELAAPELHAARVRARHTPTGPERRASDRETVGFGREIMGSTSPTAH